MENISNPINDSNPREIIKCEICTTNEFKYKCPRCDKKTCSLLCVKEHKKKYECSGAKDKFSQETNLNNFTDKELIKDMRFLNEAINVSNRSGKKLYSFTENEEKRDKEKKNKYKKKILKKMRNINLLCSPMIMTRFSENNSFVDFKMKKVFWTIKFIFIVNDSKHEHIFKETFDDSQYNLNDVIKYMFDKKSEFEINFLVFLNSYTIEDISNFKFLYRLNLKEIDKSFIKGKLVKLNKQLYEECNKSLLLSELLEGKDVYEYPEFLIIIDK